MAFRPNYKTGQTVTATAVSQALAIEQRDAVVRVCNDSNADFAFAKTGDSSVVADNTCVAIAPLSCCVISKDPEHSHCAVLGVTLGITVSVMSGTEDI